MKVDQALEDIVKSQLEAKRAARRGNRGGAGGGRRGLPRRGSGAGRRGSLGRNGKDSVTVGGNGAQKSSLFTRRRDRSPDRAPRRNERTRVHISNLDFGVSEKDLKELFGEFGEMKKADLHFDKGGRSLGTGELVYSSRGAAMKAIKQYQGIPLDGRPMKLEILGEPTSARSEPVTKRLGAPRRRAFSESPRKRGRRGSFGGKRAGGGGGDRPRRGPKEKKEEKTAEQLDKELDTYLASSAN